MTNTDILPAPTGDLVAYRECGCIGFACAREHLGMEEALELARCLMLGWKPAYLTTEQVRQAPWGCEQCKQQRSSRPLPLLATHDNAQADSPRWRVTGTVSFQVTFTVDGVVIAPSEDQALDALAEDVRPLFFYGDDEKLQHEWDDDTLTTKRVEDGAAPSQGGQPLPEGVEQLMLL